MSTDGTHENYSTHTINSGTTARRQNYTLMVLWMQDANDTDVFSLLLTTTPARGVFTSRTLAVPSPEKDSSCPSLNGHQMAPALGQRRPHLAIVQGCIGCCRACYVLCQREHCCCRLRYLKIGGRVKRQSTTNASSDEITPA